GRSATIRTARTFSSDGYRFVVFPGMTPTFPTIGVSGLTGAVQYVVCGEIRVKYDSLGGPNSFLLWPTSNELVNPDQVGRRQTFANGPIYWHPNAGAHPVVNHFMMKWGQHNWEAGFLGYPTTDEIVLQNGRRQDFQGGSIYWSPVSLGAIGGAIRDKYHALGAETGPLGYPSSDEIAVNKYNGRYNNFLNGTITWSGQTGAHVLYRDIRDRWTSTGREDGHLGYPLEDEQVTTDGIARFADFENDASIWWTAITGAHEISGELLKIWNAHGGYEGIFGAPANGAQAPDASRQVPGQPVITLSQRFDNGVINTTGTGRVLTATYEEPVDPDPTLLRQDALEIQPFDIPPGATWPPPDVAANYPTAEILAEATNPDFISYGVMPVRQGYWSGSWNDGWGQDKAEHKHQLRYPDSIAMILESSKHKPRSGGDEGRDFYVHAVDRFCHLEWDGYDCEEVERRTVHAIYDFRSFPEGYKLSPAGAPGPVGVVTAYCGGGNTPLSNTEICDPWVDVALMNPEPDTGG
ncbi:LGFP repeat-containing protein, partial [Rhodococcus zopfii]|uniref:LGFP repeat-containing protein n=1 Tax=Rhodococcus zopfii TaxID=43772 RepID=UPI001EDFA16D